MSILYFADVLRKTGLDPERVKLIRHSLTDSGFRDCYEKDMVTEYTSQQKRGFSTKYDYWCVFISDRGTLARFYACYQVGKAVPDTSDVMPAGFPHPEWFNGENSYYELKYEDRLKEYENRLYIDWGKSTRMWHQRGVTEKPIVAIQGEEKIKFPGYEELILDYDQLKEVIENSITYEKWHTALSSVNGIYLIVDRETGKQYIGSTYGKEGILGRWSCYVNSLHGNNAEMKKLICRYPERYHRFQFSILRVLPKTITEQEAVHIETLYKNKLLTIPFGMNQN